MPTILIKKSDTPGAAPTGSDLTNLSGGAEIAVNTADKRVFSMNSSSAIIELGTNPGSLTTADASATVFRSGSATITNLLATSLTVSSGSTLNGGVVINELGADADTRIEGDTDANLFFVDASTDRIGVGTNAPVNKLDVQAGFISTYDPTNANGAGYSLRFYTDANSGSRAEVARLGGLQEGAGNDGRLAFATSSSGTVSEKMTLNSSGNLGLGVTPSAWSSAYKAFQVSPVAALASGSGGDAVFGNNWVNESGGNKYITSAAATVYSQYAGAHSWLIAPSGTAGNTITFTQAMTLNADGELLIGTTSDAGAFKLQVAGDALLTGGNAFYFRDTGAYVFSPASNVLAFSTNSVERARITAGGYAKFSNTGTYVGAANAYHEFRTDANNTVTAYFQSNATNGQQYGLLVETANDQNDATRYFFACVGGATTRAVINSNGGFANYSANNVNLASDERLKKDIAPLESTWSKVKDIEVVNYRYKDCHEGDPLLYGVIAQQVQPIVPELVVVTREAKEAQDAVLDDEGNVVTPAVEASPEYYGIREQPMYWLAIKALQEAMTRIEALEAEVAALKGAN